MSRGASAHDTRTLSTHTRDESPSPTQRSRRPHFISAVVILQIPVSMAAGMKPFVCSQQPSLALYGSPTRTAPNLQLPLRLGPLRLREQPLFLPCGRIGASGIFGHTPALAHQRSAPNQCGPPHEQACSDAKSGLSRLQAATEGRDEQCAFVSYQSVLDECSTKPNGRRYAHGDRRSA